MTHPFWRAAEIWGQSFQRVSFLYTLNALAWTIICVGVVLRLAHYLFNRSLWLDESMLALNIVRRSFLELLKPLDYSQVAPLGFLMLERLAVQAFGSSEYALRLLPFLAGTASLFLFYEVAKRCIASKAVLISLGLFAILEPLVYYSSEVKQYSTDIAITLLIYLVTMQLQSKGLTASRAAMLGVIGAAAIWVSHPSVFVLAGVGVSLGLSHLRKRGWAKIQWLSIAYALWTLSFIACYFVSLRSSTGNKQQLNYWSTLGAFPPLSFSVFDWLIDTFLKIFDYPVRLHLAGIGALTFFAGCVSLFEKKERLFILLSPALFALLASGLRKYPFTGRLLLFIVPSLLLLISEGAEYIRDKTKHHSAVTGIALVMLLFIPSLLFARNRLINPRTRQEIKPVISYVKDHRQDGDVLFLYYGAQRAFEYYSKRYGFNINDYIVGTGGDWGKGDLDRLRGNLKDLDKLRGNKRVWILFSHVHSNAQNDEQFYLHHLDDVGIRLDSFKSPGTAVYLYDLSDEASRRSVAKPGSISGPSRIHWLRPFSQAHHRWQAALRS